MPKPRPPGLVRIGDGPSQRVTVAEAIAMAQQHHARGELKIAEHLYVRVLDVEPGNGRALSYLGVLRHQTGRNSEAVTLMRKAVERHPREVNFIFNLGKVHQTLGELPQAIEAYRRALEIDPRQPQAHCNLGNALHQQGKLTEALEQFERGMAACPDSSILRDLYLCALNYLPRPDLAAIFAAHRKFGELFESPSIRLAPRSAPAGGEANDRRLRIGYLSPDFKQHSVAHFIEPVLAAHDKKRFEVFCYSNNLIADDVTQRIRSKADHWRLVANLSDDEVAGRIQADAIDILVDLAGHTPLNRLTVFARMPAPVQVTWLGYPNTTGLASMDYRITDALADPVGASEVFHTEKLVRLPECFSCFQAPTPCPPVAPPPSVKTGHITFGSFNNAMKITPEVVAVWSKILGQVAGSRLILKYQGLDSAYMTELLRGQFAAHSVSPERLDILGKDLGQFEHMQRYNAVDIGLDPFPYNGTTTTLDALWMGVPVVVLAGCNHAGRVGVSQMGNLGLQELVAKDGDDYVGLAVALANDAPRLAALRSGMRDRMIASPLMDVPRFTRHLEEAFRSMWSEHAASIRR
ncbi:MAG: tetratricopeptide repeat protein [Planctomycetes bacterium]|nr:tetratricopeptide repeat protein [Planctomycetota bacterium]